MAKLLRGESARPGKENLIELREVLRTALRDATLTSARVAVEPGAGIDFYKVVNRYQEDLILAALELSGGRQNRAAKLLNMRTSTLCTKMKRLNIRS